jgi:hypothetical protein
MAPRLYHFSHFGQYNEGQRYDYWANRNLKTLQSSIIILAFLSPKQDFAIGLLFPRASSGLGPTV